MDLVQNHVRDAAESVVSQQPSQQNAIGAVEDGATLPRTRALQTDLQLIVIVHSFIGQKRNWAAVTTVNVERWQICSAQGRLRQEQHGNW